MRIAGGWSSASLATVPIFVLQAAGYNSTLIGLGLVPGYFKILSLDVGNTLRYSGLWGHPNEAAHIAALAAPAGAYFFHGPPPHPPSRADSGVLRRHFLLYTEPRRTGRRRRGAGRSVSHRQRWPHSRGADCARRRRHCDLAGDSGSRFDFFSSRFDDAGTAGNLAERLETIWFGLYVALTNPFGMSIAEFYAIMSSGTGGVVSPHNGFIFFAAIFGWLALAMLIVAICRNFVIRSDGDKLFALISFGVSLSFLFEQLPESYPFAFVLCQIIAWSYLTTKVGRDLVGPAPSRGKRAGFTVGRGLGLSVRAPGSSG